MIMLKKNNILDKKAINKSIKNSENYVKKWVEKDNNINIQPEDDPFNKVYNHKKKRKTSSMYISKTNGIYTKNETKLEANKLTNFINNILKIIKIKLAQTSYYNSKYNENMFTYVFLLDLISNLVEICILCDVLDIVFKLIIY